MTTHRSRGNEGKWPLASARVAQSHRKLLPVAEITWKGHLMIDELRKLNETWMRAWFEKDAAAVDRMTADDYVYVARADESWIVKRSWPLSDHRATHWTTAPHRGHHPRAQRQLRPGQASVAGRREF